MKIIEASLKNLPEITYLAHKLWPHHSLSDLEKELTELYATNVFFLAFEKENNPIGFSQVSLRHDYVEGTSTSPVGYLEGIFVLENYRRQGIAKRLVESAESWAKREGCQEFASDTSLENIESRHLHKALGFHNKTVLVHYNKRI